MSGQFVHLNVHTEYSIGESIVRVAALVEKARSDGLPAIAMTDQNNLFAMVKFYQQAIAQGIKPVIGATVCVRRSDADRNPGRLLLICKDRSGFENLSRLLTRSYLEGQQHGQPLIDWSWLTPATVGGLIALSGGCEGIIGTSLLASKQIEAAQQLERFREIFQGDFYLELQRTGRPREEQYIQSAVKLAADTACPVVATNEVRFLNRNDFEAFEARVCIQQGRTLADRDRPRLYTAQQYLRSEAEMQALFSDLPEALENTVQIARRCSLILSLGETHLPVFDIPEGMSTEQYLARLAKEGLEWRLAEFVSGADPSDLAGYHERLDLELGVIDRMGYPGYFLIVADFIRWSREHDIPVGPGRGSGAGSLVAYALGITDVDPIRYGLLFERFLNPERVSMPDFDIDFCMEGRDRVIDYVADRYGRDRVSQIITYGTMAAKAVIRDASRVLGFPYGFADRIAKLVPFEIGIKLDDALAKEEELSRLYRTDEEVRNVIDLARQLEGLVRNAGKHAGGVVIAPVEITNFTPLYQVEGEKGTVTQLDMKDVEYAGLVKFDFLGLRTLTIIHRAVQTINVQRAANGQAPVDIRSIPLDDVKTYDLLKSCSTTAVFQLESSGMRELIKRLQPNNIEDVIALVALYRPGPLQSGMVDSFIERRHGAADQSIDYFHPELEPVLKETYGVILYQEQVMQIAQYLAGYSLGDADLLRRAMGKKKPEEMAQQRSIFVEGAAARNIDKGTATHIFDLMEKFAGYGFNKSHSAAYGLLAYQTAWLKANYPAAFMAAVMSSEMQDTDKLKSLTRECREINLKVLPADVNDSDYLFAVRGDSEIRYGLGAIKGLGRQAAEYVSARRREDGPYKNLVDFCERLGDHKMSRRTYEAMIKAGAMDSLGGNRPSLLAGLPAAMSQAEQTARAREAGQNDMFGMASDIQGAGCPESGAGEDHVAGGGIQPAETANWSIRRQLEAERESLGFCFSGHPFDQYRDDAPFLASGSLAQLIGGATGSRPANGWSANATVTAVGEVASLKRRNNRVLLELDDGTQSIEVIVYQEVFETYRHLLAAYAIIGISGSLRFNEYSDSWQLTAKTVTDIDRMVESRATGLVIRWARGDRDALTARQLMDILEPFRPGSCSVCLYYLRDEAEARLRFGTDWSVRPSRELRERLAEAVGVESFLFVYNSANLPA